MTSPMIVRKNNIPHRVEWGFYLENTYYFPFEKHNQHIIEKACHELYYRGGKHFVDIQDKGIKEKVSVYFGVAKMHLRMKGTRYDVERRMYPLFPVTNNTATTAPSTEPSYCFPPQKRRLQQSSASPRMHSAGGKHRPLLSSQASLLRARKSDVVRQRQRSKDSTTTSTSLVTSNDINNISSHSSAGISLAINDGNIRDNHSITYDSPSPIYTDSTTNNRIRLATAAVAPTVQQQHHIHVQSLSKTTDSFTVSVPDSMIKNERTENLITTTALQHQTQDYNDCIPLPRLNHKPSKDWSQHSTSSSTLSPMSPQSSSPNLIGQEPMIASYQYPDCPGISIDSIQQQQQQANMKATTEIKQISQPSAVSIPITSPSINFSTTTPTSNNISEVTTTSNTAAISASVMDSNDYNNLSVIDISNYDVARALSIIPMPNTPQDPVHQLNQVPILHQQPQQGLIFYDQLSHTTIPMTVNQFLATWSPSDAINNMQQQVFAAGSANNLQTFNSNNGTFQLFNSTNDDGSTQMTSWIVNNNNETGSM